jgi:alkanesulfonate monooxygenase SsuD/methylene tetrahydromethanopterin reductase-like flavin-dependent oxidoreductase (luciferase family)
MTVARLGLLSTTHEVRVVDKHEDGESDRLDGTAVAAAARQNFENRGKRVEEQIDVMRLLWSKELVTFHGQWHHIPDAGINPLPHRRQISVWMGGESEVVV